MQDRPLRVLHCPTTVGGNPQGLARAERRLGLDSIAVSLDENPFAYQTDEVLVRPGDSIGFREFKRWQLLWRALRDFDVVHFNFGRSIMPVSSAPQRPRQGRQLGIRQLAWDWYSHMFQMLDLPILKAARKGIVVTYQGNDARQGDYCATHYALSPVGEVPADYYTPETDAGKRKAIATVARYADRIFALNPDLLHVLPAGAQFLPYASVDPAEWQCVGSAPVDGKVPVVVHAPSHRGVKGTRFVLDAVERLRREGVPFEFFLVENMPQAAARRLYERADLLVDQLLVGWYGALAVECMALAKPVICYLRDEDLHGIPAEMQAELPIVRATPHTIYQVLKEWLTTRSADLGTVGRASRAFVEKWHDPSKIAGLLKREYETVLKSKR